MELQGEEHSKWVQRVSKFWSGSVLETEEEQEVLWEWQMKPDIQELRDRAKGLEFYSKINGSHSNLFQKGVISSHFPYPIQVLTSEIPLWGGKNHME